MHGMVCRNAANQVIFDTTTQTVRIAGMLAVPSAGQGSITLTPSAGKTKWSWVHTAGEGDIYVSPSSTGFDWGGSGSVSGYILYGER